MAIPANQTKSPIISFNFENIKKDWNEGNKLKAALKVTGIALAAILLVGSLIYTFQFAIIPFIATTVIPSIITGAATKISLGTLVLILFGGASLLWGTKAIKELSKTQDQSPQAPAPPAPRAPPAVVRGER